MKPSSLETKFSLCWRAVNGPPLETEYRFHPERKWRFDFAHPATKVAIEIEGGTWVAGRHNRGASYAKDCEKYNEATSLGWRVYRLTGSMIGTESAAKIKDRINN